MPVDYSLREYLRKFSVADIATVAELDMATVAGYMDGGDALPPEDMQKLYGAMMALNRGRNSMCNCPGCTALRVIASSLPGTELKPFPGGALLTIIGRNENPKPSPRPKFLQRLKALWP